MLPIHPQPLPGEILSSWMVRLAFSNGFPLHSFYSGLLEFKGPLWNRDIDRHPSDRLLELLSLQTRQPVATLRRMTLCSYEGTLFPELLMNGDVRWLLPLGLFHRNRKRAGLQFCPMCLRNDLVPYYRLAWRIASVVVCPVHHCVMEDICPQCQSPIMFHRHGVGREKFPFMFHLRLCHQCGLNLGGIAPRFPDWPDCHSLEFLIALIAHGELCPWRYLRIATPCAIPFFSGLRVMLALLNGRFAPRFDPLFCGELGCVELPRQGLGFEYMDVDRRLQLMLRACWLLQDWPTRFVESCRGAHLSRSRMPEVADQLPFWFESGVSQLDQRVYFPSDEEITAAVAYLVCHHRRVTWQSMVELLSVNRDCAKRICSVWQGLAVS
ncbi:TniQ [compost metagenome]